MRRSTFIAEGASRALEKLQSEGLANWGTAPLIGICSLRLQNVPGDAAIALALRRVIEHPPELPPVLDLTAEETAPEELVRRLWLDLLPDHVRPELPLPDLLDWIVKRHPGKDTSAVLAGFTALVFHNDFEARFSEAQPNEYVTANGSDPSLSRSTEVPMNDLPHLGEIFDRFKRGCHLGPDDEPFYSALTARYDDYAAYFAPLGLQLVRHEREFFYFETREPGECV